MTFVRKSYTFQSLLKNKTLLPADSSAGSFTSIKKSDFRIEISFMEKYKFLI